jgi:subtilisin family serine protease
MSRLFSAVAAGFGLLLLVPSPAGAALQRVDLLDPLSKQHSWALVNAGQEDGAVDADIDADEAWTVSTGKGVTVAVVDSGVDATHPELAANIVWNGRWDYLLRHDNPTDSEGHGTHIAGIIAAAANGGGMTGVAPDAGILDLRVDGPQGSSSDHVAEAFARASDLGVRIVNDSNSGSTANPALEASIAAHPATLFVVSAGNGGYDNDVRPRYPCNFPEPNVLCVGASNRLDQREPQSNFGATAVDLFAPGSRVASLAPLSFPTDAKHPGLVSMTGTSMAAPHVAGAAALLAAVHPDWTAVQIKQRLLDTVDPLPALNGLSVSGGRLNAARALGVPVGAPAAPRGLSADGGIGQATLSWAPSGESDLAGYRVYPPGGAAPVETTSTSATLAGLPPGVPVELKVSAVDLAGYESPATPIAATATAPKTVLAPRLTKVRLNGRPCRTGCKATLRFTLNTTARVRFTLKRAGRRATVKTRTLSAGTHKLSMRGRVQGMKLSKGRWTLKLAVGTAKPSTLRFTVKR